MARQARRKTVKAQQSEREAIAEPMASVKQEQASMPQNATDDLRARVWQSYLRGVPKVRIARVESLDRQTVTRIITTCYAEIADERKRSNARKLEEAVARMRLVQEHAWADHDADDERERYVLGMCDARATHKDDPAEDEPSKKGRDSAATIRYQSQRSQYLRVILDAEKEIARLEGLYDGILDTEGGAVFSIRMLSQNDVAALSATRRAIQTPQFAPQLNPPDGSSDDEAGA